MNTQSNSPPFSRLIYWIKRKNLEKLQKFYPLKDKNTWIRVKHKKFYPKIDLSKVKGEIYSDLIDPLFIKKGINIRDESNSSKHREDNLYCCFEMALRDLKGEGSFNKLEHILEKLKSGCEKMAPGAFRPFSWMLDSPEEYTKIETTSSLRAKWKELDEKRIKINEKVEELLDNSIAIRGWREKTQEMEEIDKRWPQAKRREGSKTEAAIYLIERALGYFKFARGKPGRHPKPFNVLVYHLINKCTAWKIDRSRIPPYVYRKDRQHKLERDWKLILFLILDMHLNMFKLPELEEFISKHKKTPANEALRVLKERLWNTYKNFPPLEGWPLPRKPYETGFRKLIVNNEGKLEIVRL